MFYDLHCITLLFFLVGDCTKIPVVILIGIGNGLDWMEKIGEQ